MQQAENNPYKEGRVILMDKPLEWTSFDVVKKVRNSVKAKVGHAGTLDPLATGLLILCTGKFTKQIDSIQAEEKEYTGTFNLGATTPSFDRELPVDKNYPTDHITEKMIQSIALNLTGTIQQLPPIYSALKIKGEALYKKARRGEMVEVKPRQVEIRTFEITKIDMPLVNFRIVCSKGTYIRSLAFDFGKMLDSGAFLHDLRRTRIGEYKIEDAWQLTAFIDKVKKERNNS